MPNMMKWIFIILIVFSFAWAYVPTPVFAVTVGPAKIEYRADPGEIIGSTLVLINDSDGPQTLYSAFEKFTEVGGEKKFLPGEPTELAHWITLPKNVMLGPGEQRQVPVTIKIPKNAPPGGHFAVIWWGTASPDAKQVSIVTRAGILVFLRISGEVNESAELLKFSADRGKFFFGKMPENFVVLFKNNGNTYQKPKGEIFVKNIFGGKIVDFGVNEIDMILLPDTENTLRIAKKFEKAPFAFGFYKADLSLRWGEKPESAEKSVWFFVFPWKEALGGGVLLILLFLIFTRGIKKYNAWIINKSRK